MRNLLPPLLLLCACVALAAAAPASIRPTALRIDYNATPYTEAQPRFWWQAQAVNASQRGLQQSAYRIEVFAGTSSSQLLWDTGMVPDAAALSCLYSGPVLASDAVYSWRIRLWEASMAESDPSSLIIFHTALHHQGDWAGAQWITGQGLYRTEFSLPSGTISRATLYWIPLGYGRAYINGVDVGPMEYLGPWTTWSQRLLYRATNVTSLIKAGSNHCLGIVLGNGQYNSIWTHAWSPSTPPLALISVLSVYYADGTHRVFNSSTATWRTAAGPTVQNDIYKGESYDARQAQPGWQQPGYNVSSWNTVKPWNMNQVLRGNPQFSLETTTPIRVTGTRQPVKITQPRSNSIVLHFAENFVGVTQVRVRGPAGASVQLAHGEQLMLQNRTACLVDCREFGPQGMASAEVYYPFGGAVATYTLSGNSQGESWQPLFTYYGYQFVQVTWSGSVEPLTLDNFTGLIVHTDVASVGQLDFPFDSPADILNDINDARRRSLLSNMFSVESDCPTRERVGWTGDAQATAESAIHDFDLSGFWMSAGHGGRAAAASSTVPYAKHAPPVDPTWPSVFPQLQALLLSHYGLSNESSFVLAAGRYIDYVGSVKTCPSCRVQSPTQRDGLVDYYMNGDWMAFMPQDVALALSGPVLSSLHYIWDLQLTSFLHAAIGNNSAATSYAKQAQDLIPIYNQLYFDSSRQSYGPLQTANAATLMRGWVDPHVDQQVARALVQLIASNNSHAASGFVGNKYVFSALTMRGYGALALQLALQDTLPSLGYMVKQGGTTLWEDYSGLPDDTNGEQPPTHNHHFLGGMGQWLYQALAGLQLTPLEPIAADSLGLPTPAAQAWGRPTLRPEITNQLALPAASGSVATLRGTVSISWANLTSVRSLCGSRSPVRPAKGSPHRLESCAYLQQAAQAPSTSFMLNVTVPVNAKAAVHVPCHSSSDVVLESGTAVWRNGQYAPGVAGITGASSNTTMAHGCRIIIDVGSGVYAFQLQP